MKSAVPDEPAYISEAKALIGLREIKGSKHEPEILRLWADAGLAHIKDDETAWCAAFVGGTLHRGGIRGTRAANARSYCTWGFDVLEENRLHVPFGSIIVFSRPPSEWAGHVAYAMGYNRDGKICCLGGNQKDSVSVAPFDVGRVIAARYPFATDRKLLRRLHLIDVTGASSANEA